MLSKLFPGQQGARLYLLESYKYCWPTQVPAFFNENKSVIFFLETAELKQVGQDYSDLFVLHSLANIKQKHNSGVITTLENELQVGAT